MARKNNGGGSGGGVWILIIIGLICIIAEVGAGLLIAAAVVGLIVWICKTVESDSTPKATYDNKENAVAIETETAALPNERKSTAFAISHIDQNAEKVRSIGREYRVDMMPRVASVSDPLQKEMTAFRCVEVVQNHKRVLAQKENCVKKMNAIKSEIDRILACPGCEDAEAKVLFLENNRKSLGEKHNEYAALKRQLQSQKIVLSSKHTHAFDHLKNAFSKIQKSKKIISSSGTAFDAFVKMNSGIPDRLFSSSTQPMELNFGTYRFFLLPEVILVFDKHSRFITAFEPMALVITCKESEKSVSMTKNGYAGNWQFHDTLIAGDSVTVSQGTTRTSWLHERKGGGPDMRYSHNPMYQYRTDVFRHGEVTVQIGQYKATYSFSAGNISQIIQTMTKEYTSISHKPDATPSLLRLLESASKKTEKAHRLCEAYENSSENIICKTV